MQPLEPEDLLSLESYARQRNEFRAKAIAHKRERTVHLGAHLTLLFEDRLTVQYQVQEMLRIERIFELDEIAHELAAYNPLVPSGTNWKATLLIEFEDENERRQRLVEWRGIERYFHLRIGDLPAVTGIADEDLDRSNDEKTSAVHFLRFELHSAMRTALRSGAEVVISVQHPAHADRVTLTPGQRATLMRDIDD